MNRRSFPVLLVLSAVLMSLPWLVPHLGFTALFGLVPLLLMDYIATRDGVKRFWLWHYGTFVLWNAITTFWVCNATVGGGIFAVTANALQMSVLFGLFRLSKKRLRGSQAYIFLAAMWIAWERWYLQSAEISWPWLVLGNAFAQSTHDIQWYEFTGTLGGSLWVWVSNLGIFGVLVALSEGRWVHRPKPGIAALTALALVLLCPPVISRVIYHRYQEVSEDKLNVLVAQPNFDPYQKFQSMTQAQQNAIIIDQFEHALPEGPVLLLTPETFTSDILCGYYENSATWRRFYGFLQEHPQAEILFGASAYERIESQDRPSYTARRLGDGLWVESHNSALMLDHTGRTEIFHKSKLVVGTELTPYPRFFTRIDDMLGGVMARCSGQDEISLVHFVAYGDDSQPVRTLPIGSAICYESIYGEYCTGYVRKGAGALAVITNDAWWGDTPGYRQHFSYSRLRAIETRRDIARCGNTGISAFIDQRGDVVSRTQWWQQQTLNGVLNINYAQTFFVRNGDIVGRVCTFVFLLLLGLFVMGRFIELRKS